MTNADEVELVPDWPVEFELLGGYLSSDGLLYDRVLMHELGGEEEDLLAAKNIPFRARIEGILINCIDSFLPSKDSPAGTSPITDKKMIREAVLALPIADRPYLIVKMRAVAPGPIYWYGLKCPNKKCQASFQAFTDLRTLEFKPMTDKRVRQTEVTIAKGTVAKIRVLNAIDEALIEELTEDGRDIFSAALLVRTAYLDGKKPELADIKKLGTTARNKMRWASARMEASFRAPSR